MSEGRGRCPACKYVVHVRKADGMISRHRRTAPGEWLGWTYCKGEGMAPMPQVGPGSMLA
jgi:hypothetical protein